MQGVATRRRTAVSGALAGALVATGLLGGGPAGPARADSLSDARTRALALHAELTVLRQRTDAAVEAYDLAEGELAARVTSQAGAERALDAARRQEEDAAAVRRNRVRALYEAGGPGAVYATVLQSASLADAVHRVRAVHHVLAADTASQAAGDLDVTQLRTAAAQSTSAAGASNARVQRVAALAGQVTSLITTQASLIAAADAQVVQLEQAQEAAERAAAEAEFAGLAAAARARAAAAAAPPAPLAADAVPDAAAPTSAAPARLQDPSAPMISRVLAAARAQLGKPYVWGAVGPNSFDCSGFTGFAYAAAGVAMPRTAAQQYLAGPHVALRDLQPGDLLFWATDPRDAGSIDHVGMYVGGDSMIVAPHTGDVVKIQQVYSTRYFGATRVDPTISGHVAGPQWAPSGG